MDKTEIYNEKDILDRMVSGQSDAFRCIFDRYRNELFSYCCKITKDTESAKEIVQDVFLILWQKRESLNIELPIRPYLYTITQNLSFNFLKRAATETRLKREVFYLSQKDYTPEWESNYNHTQDGVNAAISKLPAKQKEIFLMSRVDFKSHDEIATHLRISKNTVKDQIFKALKSIKSYLRSRQVLIFPVVLGFF
jgi:RNA polymerase sigma-70 factor (family 1)